MEKKRFREIKYPIQGYSRTTPVPSLSQFNHDNEPYRT